MMVISTNMLGLVLCLPALFLLPSDAEVYTDTQVLDISSCPITYYGVRHTKINIQFGSANVLSIHFGEITNGAIVNFIQTPGLASKSVDVAVNTDVSSFDNEIHSAFPHIATASTCGHRLRMTFSVSSAPSDIYLMNFGQQAAAHIVTSIKSGIKLFPSINFQINTFVTAHSYTVSVSGTGNVDMTGCPDNGAAQTISTKVKIPDTCSSKTCLSTGIFGAPSPSCTSGQICMGNNVCGVETLCSVVGPSVVDMAGATGKIPDFCAYTLLKQPEISVKGVFKSHRHTDVPFLHEVVLTTSDVITIKQGGGVYKTNAEVALNATSVTEFGVKLSKDQTGVTAAFTDSSGSIYTVFYDGSLFSVNLKVPVGAGTSLTGVCTGVSSVSSTKDTTLSEKSCDVVNVDTDGDDISCTAVTQSCTDKLKSLASVIGCSVDTAPFVTLCATNLLCGYPDKDGLFCSILDAYARVCKTQVNWRASLSCPLSACVNHLCGDNEFCAINVGGEAACFCQEVFATPYRTATNHTFGDPPTCDADTALASIYTCFLEESGVNPNSLHLLQSSCTGNYSDTLKTISFNFSGSTLCGGNITEESDQIVYTNTIDNSQGGLITHENHVSIGFSCAYKQPKTVSTASFTIADGSVTLTYATAEFNFSIVMSSFTDTNLTAAVAPGSSLDLDQKVWVQLKAQGLGGSSLALLIDDCWATEGADPNGTPRYDMVTDSCVVPADGSVELVSNGKSLASVLAFNIFEFVGATNPDLSLHCQVKLCVQGSSCATSTCL